MKPFSLNKGYFAIVTGICFLALGIILTFSKTWLLPYMSPSFVLKPNSVIGEFWRKPPIKVPSNVYLFNWTNAEDVYNTSVKSKFTQLGPYRFMHTMEKVNVTWNDNNTVTYRPVRSWHFDEEPPNGNLSDEITTLNWFAWIAAYLVKDWNYFATTIISTALSTVIQNVHVTRSVKQILYEGFDDFFPDIFKQFPFVPPEISKFKELGLVTHRNATLDSEGFLNINNGINQNYDVRNWNYHNETQNFGKGCARVAGSAAELYSARHSKNDYLGVFVTYLCRELLLEYEKDVTIDGVLGYKFVVGKKILDNGTIFPENKCYCDGDCVPSGMLNITSCQYGAPTFASLPHFYQADLEHFNHVDGLKPEKDKHECYVIIEPITGIPLKAALRLQVNAPLFPLENIDIYRRLSKMMFPIFWMDMEMSLPPVLMSILKIFLNVPFIYSVVTNSLILIGVLTLSIGIAYKSWTLILYNKLNGNRQAMPSTPEEAPLRFGEVAC